jgi:hypothetical protein
MAQPLSSVALCAWIAVFYLTLAELSAPRQAFIHDARVVLVWGATALLAAAGVALVGRPSRLRRRIVVALLMVLPAIAAAYACAYTLPERVATPPANGPFEAFANALGTAIAQGLGDAFKLLATLVIAVAVAIYLPLAYFCATWKRADGS